MTDVFFDDDGGDLGTTVLDTLDDDSDVTAEATSAYVCDHVDENGVCGATFERAQQLRGHKTAKHRDRTGDKPRIGRPKGSKNKTTADRKPSAPRSVAAPGVSRAQSYASSLSMLALGAYLVVPPFDDYDLAVSNAGAPKLGAALAHIAETNPNVRRACDLILGGTVGGGYLELVMALASVAVPIMAHHGALPARAGEQFAGNVGVPPVPAPSTPSPADPVVRAGLDPTNPDDIVAFFSQVPPNVMFDLASKMMAGAEPTVVAVPFGQPDGSVIELRPTEQDISDEPGSEQLRPGDTVAVSRDALSQA